MQKKGSDWLVIESQKVLFLFVWVTSIKKDIRHMRSDIGGFSLPESLFEGT